ncbi:MAG TPA: 3-oxoacyl-ACP reductase family protein [bacterium]|nr:3-oxoacyl-ACP reductase family protein [bacterium]
MIDFTGRIALVTGGSRGIGAVAAVALARHGADVAINYRADAASAEAVRAQVAALGRRAAVVQADVSEPPQVEALVAEVTRALGPVDILVNNAGQAHYRGLDDLTVEDWERTLAVNLTSAWLVTQACLPHMRRQRWGRIVNVSSGAAQTGGSVGIHYTATKAAMDGMTRAYASRLVREGITCNVVAPALIHTDMTRDPEASALRIPMGRMGTSEECAEAIVVCAGTEFMTGQTVHLNGGLYYR